MKQVKPTIGSQSSEIRVERKEGHRCPEKAVDDVFERRLWRGVSLQNTLTQACREPGRIGLMAKAS